MLEPNPRQACRQSAAPATLHTCHHAAIDGCSKIFVISASVPFLHHEYTTERGQVIGFIRTLVFAAFTLVCIP